VPPRASRPIGIALLDKPAGPSSFALVADLRRRTRARTGHAGTLDPFATGLLVLLSGLATRLAPCFVGLDKRYITDIDLTATSSTGDPEGDLGERHTPPSPDELEERLALLRGEVELRIPAASAVKIGGERAYRLARQGIEVEMPLRRSHVYALDVVDRRGEAPAGDDTEDMTTGGGTRGEGAIVRLELHVGSGTYVRAIATALGGHCVTLRRTAVGPFRVDEADPNRIISAEAALARLPADALNRVPDGVRTQVLEFEAEETAAAAAPSELLG
jgi:tRNA pseudouridine55 synthase